MYVHAKQTKREKLEQKSRQSHKAEKAKKNVTSATRPIPATSDMSLLSSHTPPYQPTTRRPWFQENATQTPDKNPYVGTP